MSSNRVRVVIVGAGFAGLYAARTLEGQEGVDVLLIDRNNYHTFTPLLYQVATCGLEAAEIAYPIRGIFRRRSNVRFLLGEVVGADAAAKQVQVQVNGSVRTEAYDYLILALGSVTHFFGSTNAAEHALELKTLDDALRVRSHILSMFERAAWANSDAERFAHTTIVVVGGGPTGLETAGAMQELYKYVLDKEFNSLSPRVILVEATDRLLAAYPERLQEAARQQLESLGVEVVLSDGVTEVGADFVRLKSGRVIPTHTLLWMAGVGAPENSLIPGMERGRSGRIAVEETLAVKGIDSVYAAGDMTLLYDEQGKLYPTLIPVAKQQGILAAKNILRHRAGVAQETFRYIDRGIMATIGRSRAVAWLFYRIQLTGTLAWVAWLGLHLIALVGVRNRLTVLLNWMWNYFTFDRSARIILPLKGRRAAQGETHSDLAGMQHRELQ
jgi:NADH dehydrogenase